MNTPQAGNVKQTILSAAQVLIRKKGFSAVGLNEVLQSAQVPKGSFYHYFSSKDAFGVALLDNYFDTYLQEMAAIFERPALTEPEKLTLYFRQWTDHQTKEIDAGKCLAVKLGAEVADLSEPMRQALQRGTARIIEGIAAAISRGVLEASLKPTDYPQRVALQLYSLWLGASVMAKITGNVSPFDEARAMTQHVLFN